MWPLTHHDVSPNDSSEFMRGKIAKIVMMEPSGYHSNGLSQSLVSGNRLCPTAICP